MGERPGFTAIPHALLDLARLELEPVQRLLLVELIAEARWTPGKVLVDGEPIEIDAGEVLLSQRGFADRHGVERGQVRRLLKRLSGLGWISVRQAGPPPSPEADPHTGPPPTIVRLCKYRDITWPDEKAGPPPGPPPDPGSGPIQHIQHGNTQHQRLAPAAIAPVAIPLKLTGQVQKHKASKTKEHPTGDYAALVEHGMTAILKMTAIKYGFSDLDGRKAKEMLKAHGLETSKRVVDLACVRFASEAFWKEQGLTFKLFAGDANKLLTAAGGAAPRTKFVPMKNTEARFAPVRDGNPLEVEDL
jgi:hypothetical protein